MLHQSQLPDARICCKREQALLKIIVVDAQETLTVRLTGKLRKHLKQLRLKETASIEPEFALRTLFNCDQPCLRITA